MSRPVSWDDWRIVDAIASAGTTAGAAQALGLNQSTVFRRITQLESDLGVRLFVRDKRGFRLSAEGEAVLPDILRLRSVATDIERRVSGLDDRPAGEIRLSLNFTVARFLLGPHMAEFRKAHPEIIVHMDLTDRIANVKDREADLVIRGDNDPDPDLFGRKLMRLSYAVYASRDHADAQKLTHTLKNNPASLDWITWTGDLLKTAPGQWMQKHLSEVTPVATSTEVEATAYLAAGGLGCVLLPRFLGQRQPGLIPISEPIAGLYTELWVLTHEDLRKTARVSALLKFVARTIRQQNELP